MELNGLENDETEVIQAKDEVNSNEIERTQQEQQIIMKQYEQAWRDIWKLDDDYIKITMLYMTLISAYIGTFKFWSPVQFFPFVSIFLLFLSICILGIIYRTRKLLNQRLHVTDLIEKKFFIKYPEINGLGKIRTSTYLSVIVILLTVLAILLTFNMKQISP